ncbi:restriction endonuclease subunit S [Acetobacter thailandicus]|uniref:restriction endonuclease subunit S n=1 Tax=Acetobacter thailandicus TaxID=1502842 RepID=UPI001BADB8AF|nr:restriction endonuclease subunit S [Acetobacter thailandicus]MBS0960889.1 restriction endonuclease subunit S [Acetobacter thailandicus]
MSDFPQGWAGISFAEATDKIGSGATPKGGHSAYQVSGIPLIRSQNVHFKGFADAGLVFLSDAQAEKLNGVIVRTNDVLLNITGASIGRVTVAPERMDGARVNQHVMIIRPKSSIEPAFIAGFLSSPPMQQFIVAENYGVTRQALTKTMIEEIELPLPPLPEQRRIVAKIDSLTGKSRRARDHLDHIPRLVEKYRHAVLASAFSEGERAAWKNGKLEEFITDALIGLVRGKSEQSDVSGVPYIRMNHYDLNGHWNDNKLTFVEATPQEIERYELRRGDVLFNTRNSVELVGKVALWQDGRDRHVYNNNILRLRFNEKVVPRFATLWMMSEPFRAYLQTQKSATTSVCAIYQRSIMAAPFPLPSVAEQKAVVTKIDSAFAWIDRLTADATNARKLIDHLDQSVLAKAFTGELVLQDPADEPASALLDRIRAERTGAPKAKRGRKKAA